jgi:hypothetical protein
MSNAIDHLQKRIAELSERIEETKKRLPAHSTKPPIMMELLDLEDEHADLSNKLRNLKDA